MAQINKRITGLATPFVKGKAVVNNDGTFHTNDFIVDGLGGSRGIYAKHLTNVTGSLVKVSEGYYAYFGTLTDKTNSRMVIDLFKVSGKNLLPVKTIIRDDILAVSVRGVYVDTNKAMIAYRDVTNNYGKVFLATFNPATEEFTFSADYIFFSAAISGGAFQLIKTSTNRAMILYANNSGTMYGTVATFLEPDIIFGSAIQINTNANASNISIVESSPGNYLIFAQYTSPQDIILNLVSVTGATITILTNLTVHATTQNVKTAALFKVEDNHVLIYTVDSVNNYVGKFYPVTIDPATNAMTAAVAISMTDGVANSGGFPLYDAALGKLFYLNASEKLETYVYDKAAKTMTKESEIISTRVREFRPFTNLTSGNVLPATEVFPLSANLFLCGSYMPQRNLPVNVNNYPSPQVFIFDTTKVKKPVIMGVATGDDAYVEEGLVTGLAGLKPGEPYFVNPNAELVTGDKLNITIQTDTINNIKFTHEFIGYAISETELVIPRRKPNTTYL